MHPVLYYHRVGPFHPDRPRKMNVAPDDFRRQMEHLRARGYRFVTLDEILASPPGRCAAITFDDGYRDLMAHALPVLEEMKIPAAFFIVADFVGKTDAWYRAEDAIMGWDDLKELARRGHTIGCHSMTHARLPLLPAADARREIVDSRNVLEDRLAVPIRHFAYPQGLNSPAVREIVREAGYAAAWATRSGDGSDFARRRFRVPSTIGRLRFAFKIFKIRCGWY